MNMDSTHFPESIGEYRTIYSPRDITAWVCGFLGKRENPQQTMVPTQVPNTSSRHLQHSLSQAQDLRGCRQKVPLPIYTISYYKNASLGPMHGPSTCAVSVQLPRSLDSRQHPTSYKINQGSE